MAISKNFSTQQVALVTALPTGFLTALAVILSGGSSLATVIIGLGTLIVSYFMILVMLRRYIDRKIKPIYKMIYQTKATKREEFYYKTILQPQSIEEVKDAVEVWAELRKNEIEILRRNEAYRKEFLLNLSHELKTPIFAIQGYVDTLQNGALNNPDVNMKFLQNASKNINRLVNLLNDLDEISRLESGEQLLFSETFIIQDLIKEVVESLSIKMDERGIRCYIKKGCEQPLQVYADKEKVRQVLINLVDNAIKYGKDRGNIEASAYSVEGKKVLIEISDDGAGINEDHLSRIFERFYRTDQARNRKIGGSGLGLSICKHIIEAHGETIHVRSKVDVGSSFGFTLPASKS